VLLHFDLPRFGSKPAAEAHLTALVTAIHRYQARSPRVKLFGRLLGLLGSPVPASGADMTVHLLAHVHATCGPLIGEASEGTSGVPFRVGMQLLEPLVQGTLGGACPAVQGLGAKMKELAGGNR
jgi:hypothetical protein